MSAAPSVDGCGATQGLESNATPQRLFPALAGQLAPPFFKQAMWGSGNGSVAIRRVGDYAVDISKNAIKLSDQPMRPQKVEIDRIASVAHGLLLDAMRAYTERDPNLASIVIDRDDEVVGCRLQDLGGTAACARVRSG